MNTSLSEKVWSLDMKGVLFGVDLQNNSDLEEIY